MPMLLIPPRQTWRKRRISAQPLVMETTNARCGLRSRVCGRALQQLLARLAVPIWHSRLVQTAV
jgi:hypothetical protein